MHTRVLVSLVMAALAAREPFDQYRIDELFNEAKMIVKKVRAEIDEDGNFAGDPPMPKRRARSKGKRK